MNFFRSRRTPLNIRITTQAEVLEFPIDPKARVREVFEKVCNAISVRETWFFGLATDINGENIWLKSDKELRHELKCKIAKESPDQIISVRFIVKYYPENVAEELVLPVTQGLFYLQLKDDVMSGKLSVSPEMAILLASYVVQAEIGDLDEFDDIPDTKSWRKRAIEQMKQLDPVLPDHITASIAEMTIDNWYEEVFKSHQDHKGMTSEESKIEYVIKVAEKAENFGVTYFQVKLGKDIETAILHWIGITATGINLYALEDKLEPRFTWPWVEVDDLNYKGRCFYIWPSQLKKEEKKPDVVTFYTDSASTNQIILELCQSNHDLFMQRRREDSIEVQQMKEAAREEKDRRQTERNTLLREREARRIADQDLTDTREELQYFRDNLHHKTAELNKETKRSEMFVEKVKIQAEEIKLLQIQVSQKDIVIDDVNDELNRLRGENSELRKRVTMHEHESKHRKISNGDPICASPMMSNPSPTLYPFNDASPGIEVPQQNPIMFGMNDYGTENNSNSQEQIHLNYALAMVSQLNRESDRLNTEIPDQRKQFEETFTKIRQGLDDLKAENEEY